jgi:hypothetical protein
MQYGFNFPTGDVHALAQLAYDRPLPLTSSGKVKPLATTPNRSHRSFAPGQGHEKTVGLAFLPKPTVKGRALYYFTATQSRNFPR